MCLAIIKANVPSQCHIYCVFSESSYDDNIHMVSWESLTFVFVLSWFQTTHPCLLQGNDMTVIRRHTHTGWLLVHGCWESLTDLFGELVSIHVYNGDTIVFVARNYRNILPIQWILLKLFILYVCIFVLYMTNLLAFCDNITLHMFYSQIILTSDIINLIKIMWDTYGRQIDR